MIAVWKREVSSYYKSVIGWLLAAFLLIFAGIYCMAYNLSGYTAKSEHVLSAISFIYLIAVPIISMRTLAEEKRQKTDQLLYSLPMRLSSVVIGKYLGMLVVLALPVLIIALYPLILSQFGTIQYASAYGTLFGFFLLGACLLSIGLFISSVTESQVAAAVITLVTMLILYFMNGLASYLSTEASSSLIALMVLVVVFAVILQLLAKNLIVSILTAVIGCGALYLWYSSNTSFFSGLFASMMQSISVFDRFDTFVDGVFDLTAIVYYLSIIGVFLFLTVQSMEKRRWNE
ncbi:MAG: ABC transporter permease subunit [Clostridia bacterium]|nr:ABC transporter permease subunit [Clostridia bacterium]